VVGASRDPTKVGHAVLRNLLYGGPGEDRQRGFQGEIRAVNPHASEILGVPAGSLAKLEGPIDLAVFALPAPQIPAALDTAARKGVRAGIVLSAGFFEMGDEGRRLGEQVASVAQNAGIRVMGPNCTGIYAGKSQLSASFFSVAPHAGPITLLSQSGAIAQALVQQSRSDVIGLRNVVSLGDRVDVNFPELLRYFGKEEETRAVGIYAETLADAREFHEAVRDVAPEQPLVVLRAGRTGAGHRAARLHQGLEALEDRAMDSALAHPGLIRTHNLPQFLAALRALATQPPATGRRVAIVTNAGGAGVLAADAVATAGLEVAKLRPDTLAKLGEITANPRAWANPVDLLGDAKPDHFVKALEAVATAREVDAILLVLTDQAMTDPLEVAIKVCDYARNLRKPIVASFVGQVAQQSEFYITRYGIPDYVFPSHAVEGLRALVTRGAYERRLARRPRLGERKASSTSARSWR
jgi:acetyltransferase